MAKKDNKDTHEIITALQEGDIADKTSPFSAALRENAYNAKRTGKFVRVDGDEVIVEVNGNGERIPYVPEIHKDAKPGDEVSLER